MYITILIEISFWFWSGCLPASFLLYCHKTSVQVLSSNHDFSTHLPPCSFSKATLTTTPIRRISLSLRSTPDMSGWSPGSGTSASPYAWSCWAAMTRRTHRLTSNSASSPQTTAEEQSIVCSVHRLCLCVKIRADRSGCSAWSTFWLWTFSVSVKNKHC